MIPYPERKRVEIEDGEEQPIYGTLLGFWESDSEPWGLMELDDGSFEELPIKYIRVIPSQRIGQADAKNSKR